MTANQFGLTFHHFGLAVRDSAAALEVLAGMNYECGEQIYDPLQNVNLIWCRHDEMPAIELVSPADSPGPLDGILSDRPELIYHLCFSASDLSAAVDAIKKSGIRVLPVSPPKPAVLFGGRKVGFYMIKGFGLIEVVEES